MVLQQVVFPLLIFLTMQSYTFYTFSTLAMNSIPLQELADIRLFGLDFTSNLSWDKYIRSIAKRASQRVGCLYRARQYIPQLLCSTCINPQYVLSRNTAAMFGLVICPCLTVYSDVLQI